MREKIIFLIIYLSVLVSGSPWLKESRSENKCGYEGCPKANPDMLNIHLVPHSHDDVGWLKTVDQYYFGSRNNIQFAGVNYIIDSVVQALLEDPARRFIQVETAFFERWWNQQNDDLKEKVKMLVEEGRLSFEGGAWSMNDEACTHYQSIIDQFSWGLKFLNDTFGECGRPKIGWQIDPFGHSREQASLFTQMGYDGIFFGRIDYQDKVNRMASKTPEMIWKSSNNLDDTDILTGELYNQYSPPPGFCFDILCRDDPIIDDERSVDYNLDSKVDAIIEYARTQNDNYLSNNVLFTMGEDFNYMAAQINFENMDKLIKGINARQKETNVTAFYSTPSCYVKALHESQIKWPTKSDDFFPYGSDIQTFWVGYFTSRPNSKRFEREGNQFLQVCKQLTASAKIQEENFESNLFRLRSQMGVMQHHDAITGTEKQHVADDYHRELSKAFDSCAVNIKSALNQLVVDQTEKSVNYEFDFKTCLNLNISDCSVSEDSQKFMVTVYNPLAHITNQFVRFPVGGNNYEVRDHQNKAIPLQLVEIPTALADLHYRTNSARNEVVFQATGVPPLGYKNYFVTKVDQNVREEVVQSRKKRATEKITIGSNDFNITFGLNGILSEINVDGKTHNLSQNFYIYIGSPGSEERWSQTRPNPNWFRNSGAYIFRPLPGEPVEPASRNVSITNVIRGELVDEVHQQFNEWISQVVRVYKTEKFVEFEWLVGPIPDTTSSIWLDEVGREIVSRFSAPISSNGEFFTDTNGREIMKRKRNFRETWDIRQEEFVSGNYYPITAKIAIEDEISRLAILNDRAQGGSSIFDGTVELMVHRRHFHDDEWGVDEALNETAYGQGIVARGKHWLVYGSKNSQNPTLEARERLLQNRVLLSNWLFFDDITKRGDEIFSEKYTKAHSLISEPLPEHVFLMTYEPWKDNSYLIRFEHILEKDEDPILSKSVKFNLTRVFQGDFQFTEVTLGANQWFDSKVERLKFNYEGAKNIDLKKPKELQTQRYLNDLEITLRPMEIRTFVMGPSTSRAVKSQAIFRVLPLIMLVMIFLKQLYH